jgi:hypothetical protein
MGTSMGQAEAKGHSGGELGHGGMHRMGGHGSHVGSPKSNPHTQGNDAGHTMAMSHGGSFPMGAEGM